MKSEEGRGKVDRGRMIGKRQEVEGRGGKYRRNRRMV